MRYLPKRIRQAAANVLSQFVSPPLERHERRIRTLEETFRTVLSDDVLLQTKRLKDIADWMKTIVRNSYGDDVYVPDRIFWLVKLDLQKIAYNLAQPSTERFTEYLWVASNLVRKGIILDIGCVDSILAQELSRFKSLEVYGIDIRPYVSPNFNYFQESALSSHFSDEFFDQVIAVSALEHFGLMFYGNDELDAEADVKAIREIRRILKSGATVLVTVPYGIGEQSWYRTYNRETLQRLIEDWIVEEKSFFVETGGVWDAASEDIASRADGSKKTTGIVCLKLRK